MSLAHQPLPRQRAPPELPLVRSYSVLRICTCSGSRIAPTAPSANLFGLPPKPADPQGTTAAAAASSTTGTTPGTTLATPSGGLFGFGTKPSATTGTTSAAPTLGGSKDGASASTATGAAGTTTTPSLFSLGGKPDEKKDEKKDGTAGE